MIELAETEEFTEEPKFFYLEQTYKRAETQRNSVFFKNKRIALKGYLKLLDTLRKNENGQIEYKIDLFNLDIALYFLSREYLLNRFKNNTKISKIDVCINVRCLDNNYLFEIWVTEEISGCFKVYQIENDENKYSINNTFKSFYLLQGKKLKHEQYKDEFSKFIESI